MNLMNALNIDVKGMLPLLSICSLSIVVLLVETFFKKSKNINFWISVLGLFLCLGISISTIEQEGKAFFNMFTVGGYGSFFSVLFMTSALLTVILSKEYIEKNNSNYGEFYLLVLFATIGMILVASANDLIILFLGIELMSICLYVLAGFLRKLFISNEASLKYFLLGAFATGFLLYGIALIYGAMGTTNIPTIVNKFSQLSDSLIFWCGVGLLLTGLTFKVGAVPFHMWIPDVYEGSPTTISGFMSTGAKAAGFSALILIFSYPYENAERLKVVLAIIAASSMILGNIVAIAQTNIKRMLAYSSIAHAGYMIIGLAAGNQMGKNGIMFYLVAYTFMNMGAFGILALLENEEGKNLSFDDYSGLARKRPFLAALMAIFMFSLAGIPPFAGFLGKYYVFVAAINADLTWLAIVGVLTSVIAVYYYLRLVVLMYFQESEVLLPAHSSNTSIAFLSIAALVIVFIGIYPSSILDIINQLR